MILFRKKMKAKGLQTLLWGSFFFFLINGFVVLCVVNRIVPLLKVLPVFFFSTVVYSIILFLGIRWFQDPEEWLFTIEDDRFVQSLPDSYPGESFSVSIHDISHVERVQGARSVSHFLVSKDQKKWRLLAVEAGWTIGKLQKALKKRNPLIKTS